MTIKQKSKQKQQISWRKNGKQLSSSNSSSRHRFSWLVWSWELSLSAGLPLGNRNYPKSVCLKLFLVDLLDWTLSTIKFWVKLSDTVSLVSNSQCNVPVSVSKKWDLITVEKKTSEEKRINQCGWEASQTSWSGAEWSGVERITWVGWIRCTQSRKTNIHFFKFNTNKLGLGLGLHDVAALSDAWVLGCFLVSFNLLIKSQVSSRIKSSGKVSRQRWL